MVAPSFQDSRHEKPLSQALPRPIFQPYRAASVLLPRINRAYLPTCRAGLALPSLRITKNAGRCSLERRPAFVIAHLVNSINRDRDPVVRPVADAPPATVVLDAAPARRATDSLDAAIAPRAMAVPSALSAPRVTDAPDAAGAPPAKEPPAVAPARPATAVRFSAVPVAQSSVAEQGVRSWAEAPVAQPLAEVRAVQFAAEA